MQANLKERRKEASKAEAIVEQEIEDLELAPAAMVHTPAARGSKTPNRRWIISSTNTRRPGSKFIT